MRARRGNRRGARPQRLGGRLCRPARFRGRRPAAAHASPPTGRVPGPPRFAGRPGCPRTCRPVGPRRAGARPVRRAPGRRSSSLPARPRRSSSCSGEAEALEHGPRAHRAYRAPGGPRSAPGGPALVGPDPGCRAGAHTRRWRWTCWSTAGSSTRSWPAASGAGRRSTSRAARTASATSSRTSWPLSTPRPRCTRAPHPAAGARQFARATCSTGGTRRRAAASAPASPTTCSGCRSSSPTTSTRPATPPSSTSTCPSSKRRLLRARPGGRLRPAGGRDAAGDAYEHCVRALEHGYRASGRTACR